MKFTYKFTALVATSILLASQQSLAAEPSAMTVDDINACMRANIVDRGSVRDFGITSFDREGKSSSVNVKVHWKPAPDKTLERMTLQVVEPESLEGTSYLIHANAEQQNVYMYLPSLDRVQKVNTGETNQNLWGTDFTFADLQQLQGVVLDGVTQRLADETVFSRSTYVLETTPNPAKYRYTLIKTYVDQESCLMVKTELFEGGSAPGKVLNADISTLLEVEPYWLMRRYAMTDVDAMTRTEVELGDIFLLENLPGSLFSEEGFFESVE